MLARTLLRVLLVLLLVIDGGAAAIAGPGHAQASAGSAMAADCGMAAATATGHDPSAMHASHAGMHHGQAGHMPCCPDHHGGAPTCKGGCGCAIAHSGPAVNASAFVLPLVPAEPAHGPLRTLPLSIGGHRLHRPPIA
ncbi:MAG: CopL family metal-binding regulatory protein [Pseudoxanthomonas sp.]